MLTLSELLKQGAKKLEGNLEEAKLQAEILLAHLLKKPRSFLYAWPETKVKENISKDFNNLIERSLQKEPIAYLIGKREFWSLDLIVSKDTLIPRPETELLVETALKLGDEKAPLKIADLGTGSGAIALALAFERPHWQIFATDVSEKALQIARKNAHELGLSNISFHEGSWCTALPNIEFDMIVSNPPYIAEKEWAVYANGLAFEPQLALVSGRDGLTAIRVICENALNYLKPNAYVVLEHGYSQGKAVANLLALAGFGSSTLLNDLAGLERLTFARRELVSQPKLDYN